VDRRRIRTIGYEGAKLRDFIAVLQAKDVTCLVDIRDRPSSRIEGFSKSPLSAALERVGIRYIHLRSLGDPKEGRDAARRGDVREFERIFRKHLAREEGQLELKTVFTEATKGEVCLMCFERSPIHCHRKIVIEAMLEQAQFLVEHLGVPVGFANGRGKTKARTSRNGTSDHPG
jgi:uncharacterized protein (DUF488 family)